MAALAQTVDCVIADADKSMLRDKGEKLKTQPTPYIPDELSRYPCRVQATLKNITHFRIEHLESYLHAGTQYHQEPTKIASFSQKTFSSFNDTSSEGEPCGGAARFRIHLAGDYLDFSVGWNGQAQMVPKAAVTFDSPKYAYHDAAAVDESLRKTWASSAHAWVAKEPNGKLVLFTIDISAESGHQLGHTEVVYTVEQVVA